MKKPKAFRVSQETEDRFLRLSESTGKDQTYLLETALKEYEENHNDEKRRFLEIYNMIFDAAQLLEIKRDTNPETGEYDPSNPDNFLAPAEQKVLDYYHRIWDEMRELPFFSQTSSED